jgi:carboxypeptidase Taq
MNKSYEAYRKLFQEIADLKYASALMQWDQETYLPPKGNEIRGRQIATVTETAHRMFTDPKTGDLLEELINNNKLNHRERKNVELSYLDYEKNKNKKAREE